MARPHIEPFCDRDVSFKRMTLPGFGSGMHYKMLSLDVDNGACTMTVRLDGGYRRPPGFSWSELEILVMEGSLQLGDRRINKGHYLFLPAGYSLPALSTELGAMLLMMYNTGEPSFVESDSHHPLCRVDRYHDVDSYFDIPWAMGTVTKPSVATGCMIKLLNFNDRTHALTFLYCMTPDYWQDNISYHDCAEEGYHVWGTSWMMQYGDVPSGGYFWRPPYINHGAFASQYGCIAIGRTDSKLYNHFHYNPWSTPEENAQRSAARLSSRDPALYQWIVQHGHNHPHGPEDFEDTMLRLGPKARPLEEHGEEHAHHHILEFGHSNHGVDSYHSHLHEHAHEHGIAHSHGHGHAHKHGHSHGHDHDH